MSAIASAPPDRVRPAIAHLDVRGLGRDVDGLTILESVGFTADRGEVVAIAGGSGAGKSTLLGLIAGTSATDRGSVHLDGHRVDPRTMTCGYVPQDDIVHGDLPVLRTLDYAAALRLGDLDAGQRRARVLRVLDAVGLSGQAATRVGSLSGGQRKRVCIAAELLAEPDLFLLDEPTSGLDPASAADLMQQLRSLAAGGTTIVLTTHAPSDLDRCDRVVFLAPGGRHVFTGSADAARAHFDVTHLADVYLRLADAPTIASAERAVPVTLTDRAAAEPSDDASAGGAGFIRQWLASTARTGELVVRNRLTLAILLGSPVFVIAMLAALFRPGAIDTSQPANAAHMVFWIVFSAFFFGLTYGLLQIVAEREIFRCERTAGLRVGAYVASKVTVLVPLLGIIDLGMLLVLGHNGQLPPSSAADMVRWWSILTVVSTTALCLGLAASALVRNPAQATLALPMMCFPQVLFAGAIVPTAEMAAPGRILSAGLVGRWGFESFGRSLELGSVGAERWPTPGFATTFAGSASSGVLAMFAIAVVGAAVTVLALRSR